MLWCNFRSEPLLSLVDPEGRGTKFIYPGDRPMFSKLFSRNSKQILLAGLALASSSLFMPSYSQALSLPVDLYLEGDTSIIPFFPVGTVDINDAGADTVRFDLTPIAGVKFDNLGLGLDSSISKFDLVLTPITADPMQLDLGGWLGFPFKIEFTDKPMTPVSFTLSAPGLDLQDFLVLPASAKFPTTNFALRFWFTLPGQNPPPGGPIDTTAGHDPSHDPAVPEPATMLLLAGGLAGSALSKARRKN